MGLFKQMKQMKDVVKDAPEMVESAKAMQEAQMAAAQAQAQAQQAAAAGEAGEPIAGVSLELYADVARELSARGGDQSLAPIIAKEMGVDRASWDAAVAGWNERMRANPAIATRFNQLWRGVA